MFLPLLGDGHEVAVGVAAPRRVPINRPRWTPRATPHLPWNPRDPWPMPLLPYPFRRQRVLTPPVETPQVRRHLGPAVRGAVAGGDVDGVRLALMNRQQPL